MTEEEWLKSTDSGPMLDFLRGKANDRKLRLFAVACHYRIWHLLSDKKICRKTLDFAERFADGLATTTELHGRAWGVPGSAFSVVLYKAWDAALNSIEFGAGTVREAVLCMDPDKYKKRDNAFNAAWTNHGLGEARRIADAAMPIDWIESGEKAWAEERDGQCNLLRELIGTTPFRTINLDPSWIAPKVKSEAQVIYQNRTFDRLPELADDFQKAGCDNEDILGHLRGPGQHVPGCWALDLILGKE